LLYAFKIYLAMALTDEKCKQNDNIPTSDIEFDIAETQREIDQFQKELDALIGDRQGNKLAIYMREGKISQRTEFVSNLNSILEYRKALA
jgi:hypothetical protein